ncbi:PAQR family membrane homeostasis protein TrhA [Vagococcus lutrae]|uniref:PAQR family membrane homeostasis protein TrhA n=1 Tax=Vagococcus lutrae TaxID=81947 RepID=UPI00288D5A13|nr:hemolysin III family protein [Vagococcus lutrae]MDT2842927.1 hemolysin III family protein [Vagococcus lutrae]
MEQSYSSKRYLIVNEVLNAVTHGIGVGLSIAGLVILLVKGAKMGSPIHVVSYAIYGATLILLFLSSTLFHSLIFTKAKTVFQVFDHSSIYLLIAGSYTPFCLTVIKGPLGWGLCLAVWALAIAGVIYKSLFLKKKGKTDVVLYIIMGWLCLFAFKPLFNGLGVEGTLLLAGGGVAYTVGALFYSLKNVKFMHVVWHFFVLLGAALMYFSVLFYT